MLVLLLLFGLWINCCVLLSLPFHLHPLSPFSNYS